MDNYSFALIVLASILASGAIAVYCFRAGYRLGIDTLTFAHRLSKDKEPSTPSMDKAASEPVPEDPEALKRKLRTV